MIKEIKGPSRLKLELDGGMKGDRELVKSKTFSNLNPEAGVEDIYEVGTSLVGLQKLELINIKKLEELILVRE